MKQDLNVPLQKESCVVVVELLQKYFDKDIQLHGCGKVLKIYFPPLKSVYV